MIAHTGKLLPYITVLSTVPQQRQYHTTTEQRTPTTPTWVSLSTITSNEKPIEKEQNQTKKDFTYKSTIVNIENLLSVSRVLIIISDDELLFGRLIGEWTMRFGQLLLE
jgi:hypothetical protein